MACSARLPTASVRSEVKQERPQGTVFPQEMTDNVWRCGFNARSSFGAHSYFVDYASGTAIEHARSSMSFRGIYESTSQQHAGAAI
jgi:hypothetical protein